MPWEYSQRTGRLRFNGQLVARGYSGDGAGKDNPAMESVPNLGPIPRGAYRIGPAYDSGTKGPAVMNLDPVGHDAHGRTLFRIHGESRTRPGPLLRDASCCRPKCGSASRATAIGNSS